ncbi:MAG: VCBS repeat-containing protein, partial [Planctomycetota bacterium]
GAELRFEMPNILEAEPVRFEGRRAASMSVIERASRRMVMYDIVTEGIDPIDFSRTSMGAQRDATAEVVAFTSEDSERSIVTADIDQDGMEDLLVTDADANAVVLYRQESGSGFGAGEVFSAFKEPKAVGAGQWDGSGALEVFVLSEEEKTVGISAYDASSGRLGFPQPLSLATPGAEPVAMSVIPGASASGDGLAVVVRDRRDHTLEVHADGGDPVVVELEGVNRPPQSMLSGDFDSDGTPDLLLFTPNEPLVMVTGGSEPVVLSDDDMPQVGLVQAAGPTNTALLDVDGDGSLELLIADENFVRACAFDSDAGWRVVEQITLPDPSTSLTSLTTASKDGRDVIIASDSANRRLVMMTEQRTGGWGVSETLELTGIRPSSLDAGAFTGDDAMSVLAFSPEAFGLVRLSGQRVALEEFAAFRSDEEDRLEHEAEFGDINGDGYVDMIVLDAREQMCQVFTLSASRKLFFATEFRVFESRLFNRGDSRSFEPSAAIIADLTGDGADDLVLEVHDRYIIYPQMTTPANAR